MPKTFVLDVDGVILGDTPGRNFPHPSSEVLDALEKIESFGHRVCLCTGKASFATTDILERVSLTGPHVADGGAHVLASDGSVLEHFRIAEEDGIPILDALDALKIYTELYTATDFFIKKDADEHKARIHADIVMKEPKRVADLRKIITEENVVRIFFALDSLAEKEKHLSALSGFQKHLQLTWSANPHALPQVYAAFTQRGVSKGSALLAIMEKHDLSPEDCIGVGDNKSDWDFMQHCGFAAAMGNATAELQDLVRQRMETGSGTILPDVEDDGILELFRRLS